MYLPQSQQPSKRVSPQPTSQQQLRELRLKRFAPEERWGTGEEEQPEFSPQPTSQQQLRELRLKRFAPKRKWETSEREQPRVAQQPVPSLQTRYAGTQPIPWMPREMWGEVISHVPTPELRYIQGAGRNLPSTYLPLVAQEEYLRRRRTAELQACGGGSPNSDQCISSLVDAIVARNAPAIRALCSLGMIAPAAPNWEEQVSSAQVDLSDALSNFVRNGPWDEPYMATLVQLLQCGILTDAQGYMDNDNFAHILWNALEAMKLAETTKNRKLFEQAENVLKTLLSAVSEYPGSSRYIRDPMVELEERFPERQDIRNALIAKGVPAPVPQKPRYE